MSNIFKKFLYIVLLILSPLASIVLLCAIYIMIGIIRGINPLESVTSFKSLLQNLTPYFPYLTTIPVILIFFPLLYKNWSKFRE